MVQGGSELLLVHFSLVPSLIVAFLSVQSLNGHFAEVLLNAEVSQLIISDHTVVVSVISENVFNHVVNFVLVFSQKLNQSFSDFPFVELLVSVAVEWYQTVIHSLSDLHSKVIVRKLESDVTEFFLWLDWLNDGLVFNQEVVKA
jgi:hypothetical protein